MKFTYQFDEFSPLIEVTISQESALPEVLNAFESFLLASGYRFDGELDFVVDENITTESEN